jgi:hypothetical protein
MINLAYQVSYTTEYRAAPTFVGDYDERTETNEMHTRFFATREQAVIHARFLTNDAPENNGVFISEWTAYGAGIIDPDYLEERRVTATIETVTIQEIADSLDTEEE